jgi:hypothetical protein
VGVINDFRSTHSFIDFKQYGELKVFDASCTKGEQPSFQRSTDSIAVFLNFKKLGDFKVKQQAQVLVMALIAEAPPESREFFAEHQNVLLDSLR